MDVDKLCVFFGIVAIALSLSLVAARGAEVEVTPGVRELCCGTVFYNVHIDNDHPFQRSYDFEVESMDTDMISAVLEPEKVLVPSGEEEDLAMMVRVDCGIPGGEYRISINAEKFEEVLEGEVTVRIPGGCAPPPVEEGAGEPPESREPPQSPETLPTEGNESEGGDQSPTGSAVASEDDNVAIGILLVLLGMLIIMLVLIQRRSK